MSLVTRIRQDSLPLCRLRRKDRRQDRYGDHGGGRPSDHVTFIAFAPYEDPEIAIAVVLRIRRHRLLCQNVAEDIFDAYFTGRPSTKTGKLLCRTRDSRTCGFLRPTEHRQGRFPAA